MKIGILAAVAAMVMITGCAITPTVEEMAAADYGTPIAQIEAQTRAESALKRTLKDPYSARFRWGTVKPGWVNVDPMGEVFGATDFRYGYFLGGTVNAKNGFGAYVGERPCFALFHDGELVAYRISEH